MANKHNFLLGKGELLTSKVDVPKGGASKNPPYKFEKAKKRIGAKLQTTASTLQSIPDKACPNGEVVAVLTIHPRYISKSDSPQDLLRYTGLRAIGTKPKKIKPQSWGIKKHPEEAMAEQIFIAGKKQQFTNWSNNISQWNEKTPGAIKITQIEDLEPFSPNEKLKGIPEKADDIKLEVALHNLGHPHILSEFVSYCKSIGAMPINDRARTIGGLTFLPVICAPQKIEELAAFTFVRVARGIPAMRPLPTPITRGFENFAVTLPTAGPISNKIHAVIFDGGLPNNTQLNPWVEYIEPAGIGSPIPELVIHGLGVTSALLFGPLVKGMPLRTPYCKVDHVRVLGASTNDDFAYNNVLDIILNHLDKNQGKYSFINISLGPNFSIEDDDVNQWTSALDERFSSDKQLATIAAGNSGEYDESLRLNRIQPPADGVNIMSVGATNTLSSSWQRATYSSVGPGRSPGYVKPDGVAFGGSISEPFMVLAPSLNPQASATQGTSFASPYVLGCAAGTSALVENNLSPLAIRALLIHRAEALKHGRSEVGWGLLETNPLALITSEDDEAIIIYQGNLPIGKHLRAAIPLPSGKILGKITLRATIAIAPEIDPENPGAYTKGGLEVKFRPHSQAYKKMKDGKQPKHPKTVPFFSGAKIFSADEFRLRTEGFKWEPCIKHEKSMLAASLNDPCFDIWFHHREGGSPAKSPKSLPYVLIVSLRAPSEKNFYERIVRTYNQILIPIQPKIQIPIKT